MVHCGHSQCQTFTDRVGQVKIEIVHACRRPFSKPPFVAALDSLRCWLLFSLTVQDIARSTNPPRHVVGRTPLLGSRWCKRWWGSERGLPLDGVSCSRFVLHVGPKNNDFFGIHHAYLPQPSIFNDCRQRRLPSPLQFNACPSQVSCRPSGTMQTHRSLCCVPLLYMYFRVVRLVFLTSSDTNVVGT